MKAKHVPNYMWGEAVRHSTYLLNRVFTRALKDKTPYEMFKQKKPSISHLKVFGCVAYAKVDSSRLKKLDDRSRRLIYLGSEPGSKAHRLYDPTTRKKVVNRDVIFDEKAEWKWEKSPSFVTEPLYEPGMFLLAWNGLIDAGTGPINNISESAPENSPEQLQNGPEPVHSTAPETAAEPSPETILSSDDRTEIAADSQPGFEPETGPNLRRSTRVRQIPAKLDDFILSADEDEELMQLSDNEPRNFEDAKSNSDWVKAMKAEINSIEKNDTWNLIELPRGVKPIGLKWVFKVKRNADGSINKYKARLVAKGYVQQAGVDYDEVFAPVARLETIRLLIAIAACKGWELHHLDVKSAFLHGELSETVYVSQPDGFIKPGEEHKVYKLHKALYGLKQAPRAWNTKLNGILKDMQFHRCLQEQAIYRKASGNHLLIVGVYVDDLIITGTDTRIITKFKQEMGKKFEMSDLGKLTYYLGIEVSQKSDGIWIKQENYARKILKESKMQDCNPTLCPMEPGTKLSKNDDSPEVNATEYRKMVGCLRYLLQTRPDIAYAVGVISRYMQTPKQSHVAAMKQILRYLKGTVSYGIKFARGKGIDLIGYSDSSHNVDQDDGKSTTGHVFYFGSSPITWCSQKQNTVALSSCEAEFMAATSAACQALWLRELLSEITGWELQKVKIRVDNKSAIALIKNPVFHGRSKHIHTRYHFIRECVKNDQVKVDFVPGVEQRADILTKALARTKLKEMRELIGVEDLSNSSLGIRGVNVA